MNAKFNFFPWLRQGIAGAIPTEDKPGENISNRADLPVAFRVNDRDPEIQASVRLYGPGDVTGIDRRQIVRTVPQRFSHDFEPNYFPAIEFDRPDFPWLFTPAKAENSTRRRLRPWICLVVVRQQAGVRVTSIPGRPLPILEIRSPADPAAELPDLTESWAWAHAQVSGDAADLDNLLSNHPERLVSRILSPRRLEAGTRYLACLVPAFEAGREAGLGMRETGEDDQALNPAWTSGEAAPQLIALPIYYHWEFGTGNTGDFQALARRLKASAGPPGLGSRTLAVRNLGFNLPDIGTVELEGALRPFGGPSPEPIAPPFQDALLNLLNQPDRLTSGAVSDPIVAPPIYGRWQAARSALPDVSDVDEPLAWLRQLNLNPLHRAAAAFGTLVVQDQQEQLMASAWQQMADAERANQELRQVQLAREVSRAVYQRLRKLPAESLFQVTGPVHSRVFLQSHTVHLQVVNSILPMRVCSSSFRRAVRPRGPVIRRLHPESERHSRPLTHGMASGELAVAPPQTESVVVASTDSSSAVLAAFAPLQGDDQRDRFRTAAQAHQAHFGKTLTAELPVSRPVLSLTALRPVLLTGLSPDKTIPMRMQSRLRIPPELERDDPIEPITANPEFQQPMYEALRDLSQEWLLPGIENIPPDSVTLMETNFHFVESYMVGLNHEMSRELLWRKFPTDQRGTYFIKFWDDGGTAVHQLPKIHEWENSLGSNFNPGGAGNQVVLLVRGELLRQFPNTIVYAVEGEWQDVAEAGITVRRRRLKSGPEVHGEFPIFRGTIEPDITFMGFQLDRDQVLGAADAEDPALHPGWFFVFQEHATEPRFGLNVAGSLGGKPDGWRNLSWGHLVENDAAFNDLTYVSVSGPLPDTSEITEPPNVAWGFNAAHLAFITMQNPVRVAIHARTLVP